MAAFSGIGFVLAGVLCAGGIAPDPPEADGAAPTPAALRLSDALVRYARFVLTTDPLPVEGWAAARNLLTEAGQFNPDQPSAWRMLMDIALEQQDDDLLQLSLQHLVRLDPQDSAARLHRLLVALDGHQTVDGQNAMLERLLAPDRIDAIGTDVGSALALHLSTLHRQQGDDEAAQAWLDRAAALNPSHAAVIAMQVGRAHEDAQQWAEHLASLLKANPADADTALRLGLLMLEHGNPAQAVRFLSMSRDLTLATGQDAGVELDADLMMAMVLAGDLEAADALMEDRREALDRMFQQIAEQDSSSARSPIETARLQAPLPPKFAAAALLLAEAHGRDLVAAGDALIEGAKWNDLTLKETGQPEGVRARPLRMAVRLAMAHNLSQSQLGELAQMLADLNQPLDAEDELMAAATALSEGRSEEAIAAWQSMVDVEPTAGLALASALAAQRERRAAALELVGVVQRHRGTIIGALAAVRLADLLNVNVLPLDDNARALDTIATSIAPVWTRFGNEASLAVTLRLAPQRRVVQLFDPLIVNVEVRNHLDVPAAIGPQGPFQNLVAIEADVQRPYQATIPPSYVVMDIGRRLYLQPNELLSVSLNLREYWIGRVADTGALVGATIELSAVLNPRIATAPASGVGIPVPGTLGMIAESGLIQVQGRRVMPDEVDSAIEAMLANETDESVKTMAVLAMLLVDTVGTELRPPLEEAHREAIEGALAEKWPRLGRAEQAWLTSVLPVSSELGAFGDLIDASSDPLVQQVQLFQVLHGLKPEQVLDDPRLIRAMRSSDQMLYDTASFIEYVGMLSAQYQFEAEQGR
ncbi:MAG: hypothetical protein MK074_05490 [Phycisphaerales bacterium]|nr:hypothetical protein [Phycisphaerales bacterium]